jgi:hypothetical protein
MAFIVYESGCNRDQDHDIGVIEHPDLAEALAVFALLEPLYVEPVCSSETMVVYCGHDVERLAVVVGRHLLETWGKDAPARPSLFDGVPIAVLRDAVEYRASWYDEIAREFSGKPGAEDNAANARALREALFLREQRDRIAADLADMERIGAMTVEEPPVCEHDKVFSRDVLCSMPPQYPWICRKCKARGADYGSIDDNGEDYNRLAREAKQ